MLQTLVVRRLKQWPIIVGAVLLALVVTVVLYIQSAGAAVTSVTIGASTKSLDGTNTGRGVNQLVLYTHSASQTVTTTNQYGIEVAVNSSNVITSVNNRLQTGSASGTAIPNGGYVLSGHGYGTSTSGYTWLANNAQVGKTVVLNGSAPTDTSAPTSSLSAPANGSSNVIGTTINMTANATDNVGVSKVEFLVNGSVVGTDTSSPYSYGWNTTGKTAGSYTVAAKAYDAANNSATSSTVTVTLTNPAAPANSVRIGTSTRMIDGTNTSRGVNELIRYTYSSTQTITPTNAYGIEVTVNSSNVITTINNRLQTGSATGTAIPVGGYVLSGHGWGTATSGYTWLADNAGVGTTVVLGGDQPAPDTTAPTTSITSPANGVIATIGDTVTVNATASDNVGVTKVEFLVNGTVAVTDTSAPYAYAWNTTGLSAGTYTLTVKAYDDAGNTATSSAVQVTVNAVQVAISATATANANNTATLQWTTNGSDPAEWTVGRDGVDSTGYGAWSGAIAGNLRSHAFNSLRPGDTYILTVSASDGRTASATVTMPNTAPTDTTNLSVSVAAPQNGTSATVGTTVAIAANASDNVGVTKVEFLVNGTVVGTDTSSPYAYSWNTTGRTAGTYAVTAKAYDAANNTAASSSVQVTLTSNTPPTSGDWLSGVATVENGNGADPAKYFGDWRGTPVEIGQTWPHTPDVWGINPSVANSWSGFQGPMSLSYTPGPDWNGLQGWRSWSATANGDMDAWWRAAAQQTKTFRQGKGITYVSPFYEYNGDWMAYSVPRTTQGMADFRAAWERVAAIWRQEFPSVHLVLPAACARDVPQAMMPNVNSYDHVGCTIYNAWPWEGSGATNVQRMEVGRQRALANGKSFVITEWANSGNPNTAGGGGDAPGFIQAFHDYFTQYGGTGAGQLEFETFFNIDGYDLDHIMLRRNGSQVIVNPTQPQTAAKYQQLF